MQATFNLLEPSLARGLAAAHDAGIGVIAKEVFANGRLTDANARPDDAAMLARLRAALPGIPLDRVALAWTLAHPFVDVALSGAATVPQLGSHVAATSIALPADAASGLAEDPTRYWATRSALPWS